MNIILPHNGWRPRPYQMPAWAALEGGCKRLALAWHRRAGKDDVCLHWAAREAMLLPGNYWHMLPQQNQARKAIWDAVNPATGKRRIDDAFPHQAESRKVNGRGNVMGFDGQVILVSYQGACGSCPSSTAGTLKAVEGILRDEFNPEITVEAI